MVNQAKYINSPDTPIFRKGDGLFGIDLAKRPIIKQGFCLLVEGQIDCIRLYESGIENVVAPLGTAFTEAQAKIIKRLCNKVVLLYDGDKAGLEASKKAFCILAQLGLEVKNITLPTGDPDNFLSAYGKEALIPLIESAPDFIEALVAVSPKSTPQDKLEITQEAGRLLGYIQEPVLRSALIDRCAAAIGVGKSDIESQIRSVHAAPEMAVERVKARREYIDGLILLLAQDSASKDAWNSLPWEQHKDIHPSHALVEAFAKGDYTPETVKAWAAMQDGEIEKTLLECMESTPMPIEDCWRNYQKEALTRKLDILKAKQSQENSKELLNEIAETWSKIKQL
jgi:DNA primase